MPFMDIVDIALFLWIIQNFGYLYMYKNIVCIEPFVRIFYF